MDKPNIALSQLEREPTVYLNCTYSEVKKFMWKSLALMFGITLALAIIINISIAMIIACFVSCGYFQMQAKTVSKKRVDKPLFYEKHLQTYKSARHFIQPAKLYQRERNTKGK